MIAAQCQGTKALRKQRADCVFDLSRGSRRDIASVVQDSFAAKIDSTFAPQVPRIGKQSFRELEDGASAAAPCMKEEFSSVQKPMRAILWCSLFTTAVCGYAA